MYIAGLIKTKVTLIEALHIKNSTFIDNHGTYAKVFVVRNHELNI